MPTELRHIIFTSGEVVEAIALYRRSRSEALPSGRVTEACAVESEPGTPIIFRLSIAPDAAGGPTGRDGEMRLELAGPDLAAALIGYCRARSIPMPVKGSKSLQRFGSQIGLIVAMGGRNGVLPARLAQAS